VIASITQLELLELLVDLDQSSLNNEAHLSKRTSDLKQKCTQLAKPWGTVFHALSHGVIHFVRSVRSRNHFLFG